MGRAHTRQLKGKQISWRYLAGVIGDAAGIGHPRGSAGGALRRQNRATPVSPPHFAGKNLATSRWRLVPSLEESLSRSEEYTVGIRYEFSSLREGAPRYPVGEQHQGGQASGVRSHRSSTFVQQYWEEEMIGLTNTYNKNDNKSP